MKIPIVTATQNMNPVYVVAYPPKLFLKALQFQNSSEACQSSSQSDSSDSDSSTSSVGSSSRSPSPEFSVTSSQTNGLRLTIATVRKSTGSPPIEKMTKVTDSKLTKSGDCTSSSDSMCSSDSASDSEASNGAKSSVKTVKSAKDNVRKVVTKLRTRASEKKSDKKNKKEATSAKGIVTRPRPRQRKIKKVHF